MSGRFVCLLLVIAVSGCVDNPTGGELPDKPLSSFSIDWALVHPYVINSTANGSLIYSYTIRSDCPFQAIPGFTYIVYDRFGMVATEEVPITLAAGDSGEVHIPLEGTAPFVLAGQANACVKARDSEVSGITSGHPLWSYTGYDLNAGVKYIWTNFTMPAGVRSIQHDHHHPAWSWKMDAGGADVRMPPATSGTITLHYPDGTIAHHDDYSLTSGHSWTFPPFQWMPGTMRINVDLDRPALDPIDISYITRYRVFHEDICEHGLEWEICT